MREAAGRVRVTKSRVHLDLYLKVDQLGRGVASQRLYDFTEGRAYRVSLVAYHRHSQDSKLAVILRFHLRNRDVETISQSIFDAAQHVTFILEAPGFTH
jgi:hypothetical protein